MKLSYEAAGNICKVLSVTLYFVTLYYIIFCPGSMEYQECIVLVSGNANWSWKDRIYLYIQCNTLWLFL